MASSHPPRPTRHPSPLAAGASYTDYRDARERFLETLLRDWELRRLEAAWGLPPARAADGDARSG
jgi:hypothetical protein